MARFDGVQGASGAKGNNIVKIKSIQQQIEALANSLPARMPEGMSESERMTYLDRAIQTKDKIIKLKEQLRNMAQQNDPSCVSVIGQEIATIKAEKAELVDMKNSNSSVFSQNAKFSKDNNSIFS